MTQFFSSLNGDEVSGINVSERGLAYGDGHFTTAKILNGQIEHIEKHIQRLNIAQTTLKLPSIDLGALQQYLIKVAHGYELAVLKVMITAGNGGRGYSRKGCSKPNIYVSISEFPLHYLAWSEEGINIGFSDFTLTSYSCLSSIKHLNRLEQVMIRVELDEREEQDLIVCNQEGNVVSASCANVFWFEQGKWFTPEIKHCGINGIMRQRILSLINNVTIGNYLSSQLDNIEAMFITNGVMGVVPVHTFCQRTLSIAPVRGIQELNLT